MTVNKITTAPTSNEVTDKINEIIDNLGGSVAIDNTTITENASDELQTVAVIDNRSGSAIKTWTGTKVQYDAIVTKDANTLYNITDDTDVTLSLLELLYPVGSIYIGTMATCPLATLGVGTWVLKASDRVLQGAGTRGSVGSTLNESLPNINATIPLDELATTHGTVAPTGAVSRSDSPIGVYMTRNSSATGNYYSFSFNANNSSSTYQNDAPVQQDAYIVNIWERTA